MGTTTAPRYAALTGQLGLRLDALATTAPIAFRAQNGGDYEIPSLTLRAVIAPGVIGYGAHVAPQGA